MGPYSVALANGSHLFLKQNPIDKRILFFLRQPDNDLDHEICFIKFPVPLTGLSLSEAYTILKNSYPDLKELSDEQYKLSCVGRLLGGVVNIQEALMIHPDTTNQFLEELVTQNLNEAGAANYATVRVFTEDYQFFSHMGTELTRVFVIDPNQLTLMDILQRLSRIFTQSGSQAFNGNALAELILGIRSTEAAKVELQQALARKMHIMIYRGLRSKQFKVSLVEPSTLATILSSVLRR